VYLERELPPSARQWSVGPPNVGQCHLIVLVLNVLLVSQHAKLTPPKQGRSILMPGQQLQYPPAEVLPNPKSSLARAG